MPNRCARLGASSRAATSVSPRPCAGYGASSGASSAVSTKMPQIVEPDHAQRVTPERPQDAAAARRRRKLVLEQQSLGPNTHSSLTRGSSRAWTMSTTRLMVRKRDRAEERDPHDHRVVEVEQRVGRELADPGPVEDDLDEERPGQQVGERQPGDGQRRRQRVAQREPPEDPALA